MDILFCNLGLYTSSSLEVEAYQEHFYYFHMDNITPELLICCRTISSSVLRDCAVTNSRKLACCWAMSIEKA